MPWRSVKARLILAPQIATKFPHDSAEKQGFLPLQPLCRDELQENAAKYPSLPTFLLQRIPLR